MMVYILERKKKYFSSTLSIIEQNHVGKFHGICNYS